MEINNRGKAKSTPKSGKKAPSKGKGKTGGSIWMKTWKIAKIASLIFFSVSILSVILFRWINPPITPLMVIRSFQYTFDGKEITRQHRWIPIDSISPQMITAIVSSEDQNFLEHYGFDFKAIQKASAQNAKDDVKVIKGASTISQQTAKNVFLWPNRDWIRKGLETYFTVLIEAFWTKERIMEVYLNIIEFGEGIYGIEAASQHYYHKRAFKLNARQAASLAAVVPAPRKWSPIEPSNKVIRHTNWILKHAAMRGKIKFDK